MAPPRILLCGDVLGRTNQLCKRVSSVNKSTGPFDALLCVGQFFPDSADGLDELISSIEGRSTIPIPTYFIGDYGVGAPKILSEVSKKLGNQGFKMDGLKVCENLFWLRGSGKFLLHGLSVAYLSGRQSESSQLFGGYNQDDVDALRAVAEEPGILDLFLTNEWPSGVLNQGTTPSDSSRLSDSYGIDSTVAELVAEMKPRYHIAGTKDVFYAREPYSNVDAVHVTRFLGLASVGNKDKQKFIHAISPTPASTMSASEISMKPPNTTSSPYAVPGKASHSEGVLKRPTDSGSDAQYWRYDVSQKRQKHGDGVGDKLCFKFISSGSCSRGDKCYFRHDLEAMEQYSRGVCFDFLNKGKCVRSPGCNFKHSLLDEGQSSSGIKKPRIVNGSRSKECWFCLSSPNVDSHLITSVGEHYYCALAKGPLVEDHVLIIPIEHSPNTLSSSPEMELELCTFQKCLNAYFKSQGKEVVFFEWVSKRGTHANVQVVPVPLSRAPSLQDIFSLAAKRLGFKFVATKYDNDSSVRDQLRSEFDANYSLFYVELPGGVILKHIVGDNEKFPAQFGREVMAGLLNVADKADWKNCTVSQEEETKIARTFKHQFEEFDPNN